MKIYLSGKITGTTDYMERFSNKQKELELRGDEVINPALINSFLPKSTTWEEYMSLCYPMIDMCEAIYFLDGWENSKGAKIEFDYAMKKKKLICFKTENENEVQHDSKNGIFRLSNEIVSEQYKISTGI